MPKASRSSTPAAAATDSPVPSATASSTATQVVDATDTVAVGQSRQVGDWSIDLISVEWDATKSLPIPVDNDWDDPKYIVLNVKETYTGSGDPDPSLLHWGFAASHAFLDERIGDYPGKASTTDATTIDHIVFDAPGSAEEGRPLVSLSEDMTDAVAFGQLFNTSASSGFTSESVQVGLTGFGSTAEAWTAAHESAPGYDAGTAFLPLVELSDGETSPKYAAVDLETPVVSYELHLPAGTDIESAKAVALQEFPGGATYGSEASDGTTCTMIAVESEPVQSVLDNSRYAGDRPVAIFGSSATASGDLDPEDITDVVFSPLDTASSDFGAC